MLELQADSRLAPMYILNVVTGLNACHAIYVIYFLCAIKEIGVANISCHKSRHCRF